MTESPLFPENVGEMLYAILHPAPSGGPPYTHTFNLPPDEYDDDGNLLRKPVAPTLSVDAAPDRPEGTERT